MAKRKAKKNIYLSIKGIVLPENKTCSYTKKNAVFSTTCLYNFINQ